MLVVVGLLRSVLGGRSLGLLLGWTRCAFQFVVDETKNMVSKGWPIFLVSGVVYDPGATGWFLVCGLL